jgi:hypothetical protein
MLANGLNVPQTENYKYWQQEIDERLKKPVDVRDKPKISAGSRQIMENKRNVAESQGNNFYRAPVYERLHAAAIQKQQSSANSLKRGNRSFSHRGPLRASKGELEGPNSGVASRRGQR